MKAGFKVGDKCTIRQWEDMEAEFGSSPFIDDYRRISTPDYSFVPAMRPLCGRKFTISKIQMWGGVAVCFSEEHVEEKDGGFWVITFDMLTPDCNHEDEDAFEPAGIETLLDFFRG